ncbi:hypothetical protein F5Y14DRAFT_443449 [Nemania sp. NC0429]|nr:hypothetical protein F5Y14DRAFT_443449 [Nemania sp. NC0429]
MARKRGGYLILKQPALKPPKGVVPDFVNPPNKNRLAIAVISVTVLISTVSALIRAYTRLCCIKKAFYIGATGMLARITYEPGLFVHQYNLYVWNLSRFIYLYVFSTILYCFTLMLIKAAMLLEWIRMFVPGYAHNTFWWICSGMIVANSGLYVATIVTINLICVPQERIWHRWVPGTCININAFNIFIAAFNLAFDLLILFLPHRIIWKLALTRQQKIGVSIVFSVGAFACVSAAGRVASSINMSFTQDTTYAYSRHLLWGLAENTSALLVFCVPAIPLVFRDTRPMESFYYALRERVKLFAELGRSSSNRKSASSWPHNSSTDASVGEWANTSQVHLRRLGPGADNSADSNTPRPIPESGGNKTDSNHRTEQWEGPDIERQAGILRTTEIEITTSNMGDDVPAFQW